MSHRILFVCLGNICRSPTAEAVFRNVAAHAGLAVDLDSAGTAEWHVGKPPYAPMQKAAAARGYDLSSLRARQFRAADFNDFDLLIAMDRDNAADMERLRPPASETPLHIFTDFAPQTGADHVPDPYFTRDFDATLDLIEIAAQGLLAHLGPADRGR